MIRFFTRLAASLTSGVEAHRRRLADEVMAAEVTR